MPRANSFQTVPLRTTGSSYQSRSIPISAQRTFNMYPEITPDGITESALLRMPGWALFNPNFTSTPCKGMHFWADRLYVVRDGVLVWYSEGGGNPTVIGGVIGPSDIYSFSDNGDVMTIATGGSMYQYDGTTLSVVPSVSWGPKVVRFLNERFITDGDDGGTYVSDVLSTNFDIANVFYTRASTDDAVCPYVFNQIIYGFGKTSVEPWEDVGVGLPPMSRINGGIIESVGVSDPFAITSTEEFMYFLGTDAIAYRVSSFNSEAISNTVISTHFRGLNIYKVKADSFIWDGQRFILFTFYGDNESWVFSETTGAWFEIGGAGGDRSKAFNLISAWSGEVFGCDYTDGTVWRLDEGGFLHGNTVMEYERVLPCISGDDFGSPQEILEMSKLVLNIETGFPVDPLDLPSTHAAYPNPSLMVQPSFDGGYTWGKEIFVKIGTRGDFTRPTEVHIMKQFRRAVFRIKMNAPVERFTIYSAAIDIRVAGK